MSLPVRQEKPQNKTPNIQTRGYAVARIAAFLSLIMLLSACGHLSYYAQATKGQLEILVKRKSISTLLGDSQQKPPLLDALRKAKQIRDFASRTLGLPDNKTFRYYSDIGRPYAVWNVIATPRFSLSPKTWCFPIAGCVAYKGYFSESDAKTLNQSLIDAEHDTFLYGVSAYSTLGWFSDPLLNTFIHYDELSLGGLVFHELSHQVVYVKDDSRFNEAFATAVEIEGLRQWIKHTKSKIVFQKYLNNREKNHAITEMVLSFRQPLTELYRTSSESMTIREKQGQKELLFVAMKNKYQEMKENGQGTAYYDWWFTLPLNNAHLIAVATYYDLVPAFSNLISQSEDLPSFFEKVRTISKMEKADRDKALASYMK
ncbi:MAG: aminopeptidase [Gammaproteobacteria bacterium]|nr:aminopeptidase [Gammaproteobacteria bacterium]